MSNVGNQLAEARLRSYVRTLRGVEPEVGSDDSNLMAGHIENGKATCLANGVRSLGPALWWAASKSFVSLDVIVEATPSVPSGSGLMSVSEVAGHLCRRASLMDAEISIWEAAGTSLSPAVPVDAVVPPELPPSHWTFAESMSAAGARPIDDHGRLIAEVAGLEVARVTVSPDDGLVDLEIGVGQADRELHHYIHGGSTDDENLRRCVASVNRDRKVGTGQHPLARIVRQRWLRSVLLDSPGLVGLSDLEPVVPLRPSATVLRLDPAAAYSPRDNTVVVCSVGVDPDLLPEAADYRRRINPEAKLLIVLPERDKELATGRLIDIVPRVEVVSIEEPWSAN